MKKVILLMAALMTVSFSAQAQKKSKEEKDKKPRPAYHKAPSTEENVLCSLDGEIVSFMELFDRIFQEYPRLLSDGHYRQELIQIMQKMKQYIADIEGGRTE